MNLVFQSSPGCWMPFASGVYLCELAVEQLVRRFARAPGAAGRHLPHPA